MSALRAAQRQYDFDGEAPPSDPQTEWIDSLEAEIDIAALVGGMMLDDNAQWLQQAVAYAMKTGDAIYLLNQCRKHLQPVIRKAAETWAEELGDPT